MPQGPRRHAGEPYYLVYRPDHHQLLPWPLAAPGARGVRVTRSAAGLRILVDVTSTASPRERARIACRMEPAERVLAAARTRNVLLGPRRLGSPAEDVQHLLAVQAEEPRFSRWSVAQRTTRPDEAAVARALANAEIVRVHALRPTWHYLRGEDLRWVQALTGPRVLRSSAGWYR